MTLLRKEKWKKRGKKQKKKKKKKKKRNEMDAQRNTSSTMILTREGLVIDIPINLIGPLLCFF